jgi:hypothetical protein
MTNKRSNDNSRRPRKPIVPPPPPAPGRPTGGGQNRPSLPPVPNPDPAGDELYERVPPLPPFRPRRSAGAFPLEDSRSRLFDLTSKDFPEYVPLAYEPTPSLEAFPATEDLPERKERVWPGEGDKLFNVPMICTRHDRGFVVVFRSYLSDTSYRFDRILADVEITGNEASSPSLTVPVTSLSWFGITCPHCQTACRPIHCGSCGRLACDGQIAELQHGELFKCAASCGTEGIIHHNLKTITGGESRHARRLALPAPTRISAPETPAQIFPRLPKPR